MALSDSYDFTLTAAELIAAAYRKIGITSATTTQNTNALQALEIRLKSLASKGFNLIFPWNQEWITQALTESTASYILAAEVRNIDLAFIRRSSADTPVSIIEKEEYFELGSKSTEGLPNSMWLDKQLAGITLYLYPVPENSTDVLHMLVVRKFQDIDSTSNNIDIDATWFLALTYLLAADLAPEENVLIQDIAGLLELGNVYLEDAKSSTEDLSDVVITLAA